MSLRLTVKNLAALKDVDWTIPQGVSALVGPNGSGKTTLLSTLELLSDGLRRGLPTATDEILGGAQGLLNSDAPPGARISIGLSLDQTTWKLTFGPEGATTTMFPEESLEVDGKLVLRREAGNRAYELDGQLKNSTSPFLGLKTVAELEPIVGTENLLALLSGFRLYRTYEYDLRTAQRGSLVASHRWLHERGTNVFAVLRNWRDQRVTKPRYAFVLDSLREIFPGYFSDFDFDVAGQTVTVQIITKRWKESLPVSKESTGFFVALLSLCAVASAEPGTVVAIDEPENSLHPFGLRKLLNAISSWSLANHIHVVLATHSPVILNQFRENADHLFVMEPGEQTLPVRLNDLVNPLWIERFQLGDMYANLDYGAPLDEATK